MDTYRADITCERMGPPTRNLFTPGDRPSNRLSGQLSAVTGACLGAFRVDWGCFKSPQIHTERRRAVNST